MYEYVNHHKLAEDIRPGWIHVLDRRQVMRKLLNAAVQVGKTSHRVVVICGEAQSGPRYKMFTVHYVLGLYVWARPYAYAYRIAALAWMVK